MPRGERIDRAGAIQHVTQRGNQRTEIFGRPEDCAVYLSLLHTIAERLEWRLLTYCLMRDHVHLLMQTPKPNLSLGMGRLSGAYARKYNESRGAVGHVFEGRFKNRIVANEDHLFTAFAYIALNPVRRGLCFEPEQWPWSAHGTLVGHPLAGRRLVATDALRAFDARPAEAVAKYQRLVVQVAARAPASAGSS